MSLPVVDCRSLVEFCRAYEQHRKNAAFNSSSGTANNHHRSRSNRSNCHTSRRGVCFDGLADSFCDQFTLSAIADILLLLLVIGALAVLVLPYLKFLVLEASELLLVACFLIGDFMYDVPLPYLACSAVGFFGAVILWAFLTLRSKKCGKPYCKGLRKSVEFDIQLETEHCVKCYPPTPKEAFGAWPVELGEDRKELEAELKKMAPINGRTVLIFRAPCGCPTGRMEVWGPKKVRRIKK
uniref:Ribosomal protein L34e superfamily protein n=1 Tax=Kalanchoe fedtschenkoi TaxID=63787 RepID=A0A7N0T944_KALFE